MERKTPRFQRYFPEFTLRAQFQPEGLLNPPHSTLRAKWSLPSTQDSAPSPPLPSGSTVPSGSAVPSGSTVPSRSTVPSGSTVPTESTPHTNTIPGAALDGDTKVKIEKPDGEVGHIKRGGYNLMDSMKLSAETYAEIQVRLTNDVMRTNRVTLISIFTELYP